MSEAKKNPGELMPLDKEVVVVTKDGQKRIGKRISDREVLVTVKQSHFTTTDRIMSWSELESTTDETPIDSEG